MKRTLHRRLALPVLAALVAVPVVLTAGPATADKRDKRRAPRETVKVRDNYFEPARLKVRRGTVVKWKWPKVTGDSHDVTLRDGPRKARKFQSPVAASDFTYRRKLRRPGKYRIICTLHAGMRMTIVVRGRRGRDRDRDRDRDRRRR